MIITARRLAGQLCWSEPWTGFSARTGFAASRDRGKAISLTPLRDRSAAVHRGRRPHPRSAPRFGLAVPDPEDPAGWPTCGCCSPTSTPWPPRATGHRHGNHHLPPQPGRSVPRRPWPGRARTRVQARPGDPGRPRQPRRRLRGGGGPWAGSSPYARLMTCANT